MMVICDKCFKTIGYILPDECVTEAYCPDCIIKKGDELV